jgi:hypothetical protein
MKKIFLLIAFVSIGCGPANIAPPVEKMKSKNGWTVELCFEKDQYKVYRFTDGAEEWRYYVVPKGEMIDHTVTQDEDGNKTYHLKNTQTVR